MADLLTNQKVGLLVFDNTRSQSNDRVFNETARLLMRSEQRFHFMAQNFITAA